MKHPLPHLDTLKAFESAARLLSFTRAADELCVSKGAVGYQVKKLEQYLGQPLFKRTTRQILLTDAGQLLYQNTQHWFQQLHQQFAQLMVTQKVQLVIAVTTYTAVRWLSPRLAAFSQTHQELQIILQHSINQPSFDAAGIDLSIRWQHHPGDSDCFIKAPLFPVANTELAAKLPTGKLQAGNLGVSPWRDVILLTEPRQEDLWQFWNNDQPAPNPRYVIEDANVRVQAAIDGQGIILADQLMQAEIEAGTLVNISDHTYKQAGYAIKAHTREAHKLLPWLRQ
ncbi:MAG: LysR family transcriptional regulator [Gammaproteobacteria bacterium]|jgi:DNA-binding transcriptional LysR family regulator|nr:LysR family transcriptional regulator [Gammaproteobacteria bacterium]